MLAVINSLALMGIDSQLVRIEVDVSGGLPSFCMVGLPDGAVKESRERVFSALKNSEFEIPSQKITINLAPAYMRKIGSGFDLPIAIGMLLASGRLSSADVANSIFTGELSLDGKLRPVKGVLSMAMYAKSHGYSQLVIPGENFAEALAVGGIDIIPLGHLKELALLFSGNLEALPNVTAVKLESRNTHYLDFADIRGQGEAKRGCEVAAAGGHNILMVGSPGCGKTMLAKALPGILPEMTEEESLITTMVYSAAGNLSSEGVIKNRPFRSPHHTISNISLVGGGYYPKPGEVSLAHNGVLFLDELGEFKKPVLEALRQPLEDGKVNLNRNFQSITYPSQSMLVGAMNPCPCGNLLDPVKNCVCRTNDIKKYLAKISGPLLDRIDIQLELSPLTYENLNSASVPENSLAVRKRVTSARKIQWERFSGHANINNNGQMSVGQLKKHCSLEGPAQKLLEQAMTHFGLTARAYHRIIKLSRTIADLDQEDKIRDSHVAEAIHYRCLDRTRTEFR